MTTDARKAWAPVPARPFIASAQTRRQSNMRGVAHMPKKKPVDVEKRHHDKDWHAAHKDRMTVGQRIADAVASGMGSWRFIIIQSLIVAAWIVLNLVEIIFKPFDPY